MKKSGLFAAASVAAASATAISASASSSSSSSNTAFVGNSSIQFSREEPDSSKDHQRSSSTDKFAPRFDGLRFIETLVTAHR
uniref:Uncharacterized protein n=1 Tax=Rhizophora mucronata TaxID=61149 RepID=A0A2P2JRR6_RHIMU